MVSQFLGFISNLKHGNFIRMIFYVLHRLCQNTFQEIATTHKTQLISDLCFFY